jgi:hypothetical protein
MYESVKYSPLVNLRAYVRRILYEIAKNSTNPSSRQKALSYTFDVYDRLIPPKLNDLWLEDFNDDIKQKILNLISHQYTKENLSFYSESIVKQDMITFKDWYKGMIEDSVKTHKITFDEARQFIYHSQVEEKIERFYNNIPEDNFNKLMIIAAQLNITEAVPYLKKYADDEKYKNSFQPYAIFSLACMRIEDYERKAVEYFRTDNYIQSKLIHKIINSQGIWYTYIERLKSEKYWGNCPVAYETIRDLHLILSGFPDRYIPKRKNASRYCMPEPYLIPDDCGFTDERIPIDDEVIKIVVDWMEENKGNYKLLYPVKKTY